MSAIKIPEAPLSLGDFLFMSEDDDKRKQAAPRPVSTPPSRLVEGIDYYLNEDGFMVFTAHYLSRRGFCCESGCRHCPYGYKKGG